MKLFGRKRSSPRPDLWFFFDEPEELEEGDGIEVDDDFTHAVGHTALGHVFVRDESSGLMGVYHPFRAAYREYGRFASLGDFARDVLADADFREEVLQPELVAEVAARTGAPEEGEVLFPVPYEFLGGSGAPDTYDRGALWPFLAIVHQMIARLLADDEDDEDDD